VNMASRVSVSVGEQLEEVLRQTLLMKRALEEHKKEEVMAQEAREAVRHADLHRVRGSPEADAEWEKLILARQLKLQYHRNSVRVLHDALEFRANKRADLKRKLEAESAEAEVARREAEVARREAEARARKRQRLEAQYVRECVEFDGDDFKNWMCRIGCERDL
jgi:hypothetical protein